jgi:hypothetical protein
VKEKITKKFGPGEMCIKWCSQSEQGKSGVVLIFKESSPPHGISDARWGRQKFCTISVIFSLIDNAYGGAHREYA